MKLTCIGPGCTNTKETTAGEKNFDLYKCSSKCRKEFNDDWAKSEEEGGFHFPLVTKECDEAQAELDLTCS